MVLLQSGRKQELFEAQNNTKNQQQKAQSAFIAESDLMKHIHNKIRNISHTKRNVLILGAEGTGRSATAYEVFYHNKNSKEFVQIDCKNLTSHLLNQMLFGDKNSKSYKSLLNLGENKTLYIKNIDLMSLDMQKKLYFYLSTQGTRKKHPRLIVSSGESLSQKIQDKLFFQDLFNIISEDLIILPLLKERQQDIFSLLSYFNKKNNFKGCFNNKALDFLNSYEWYGNITELKNICLKLSILYHEKDIITKKDLSYIIKDLSTEVIDIKYSPNLTLNDVINLYIEKSLVHFKCKKRSASALGISVKTLYNKIKIGAIREPLATTSDCF